MGYYINPPDRTKQQWLLENGELADPHSPRPEGKHFVCLVDNGWMTAACIAFNDGELEECLSEDGRPKTWYLVEDTTLLQVTPSVPLA